MGEFVNPVWIKVLAWTTAAIIVALNVKYLSDYFGITRLVRERWPSSAMYSEDPRRPREQPRPTRACCRTSHELARSSSSELLLIHVADGWVARNFDQLKLAESEEMKADRAVPRRPHAGDACARRACRSTSTWRWAIRRPRS